MAIILFPNKNDGHKNTTQCIIKQGQIIHRSRLNNENNKNEIKKYKKRKFILSSKMVKADIFLVKEKNKVY